MLRTDFNKDFLKLLNNADFGKTHGNLTQQSKRQTCNRETCTYAVKGAFV